MGRYPDLSEADSIMMEILWREGECSSAGIVKQVEAQLNWSRQTVRTYLARLIDKGLVGTKAISRRSFLYYPIVSREAYAADRAGSVMNRFYGSVPHLLAGLMQEESLSEEELDELEQLIRQARSEQEEK